MGDNLQITNSKEEELLDLVLIIAVFAIYSTHKISLIMVLDCHSLHTVTNKKGTSRPPVLSKVWITQQDNSSNNNPSPRNHHQQKQAVEIRIECIGAV